MSESMASETARRLVALEAKCEDMQRQITHLLSLILAHPRFQQPAPMPWDSPPVFIDNLRGICSCPPGSACSFANCPRATRVTMGGHR